MLTSAIMEKACKSSPSCVSLPNSLIAQGLAGSLKESDGAKIMTWDWMTSWFDAKRTGAAEEAALRREAENKLLALVDPDQTPRIKSNHMMEIKFKDSPDEVWLTCSDLADALCDVDTERERKKCYERLVREFGFLTKEAYSHQTSTKLISATFNILPHERNPRETCLELQRFAWLGYHLGIGKENHVSRLSSMGGITLGAILNVAVSLTSNVMARRGDSNSRPG